LARQGDGLSSNAVITSAGRKIFRLSEIDECSLPCSQKPATAPHSEANRSIPQTQNLLVEDTFFTHFPYFEK
jgi:hypothetical protein